MSFSQMRPQTSQLMELHVFYVPAEVWNFKLNTVPVALTSKFVSAGFIRVSPHITLRVLREKLGEYLGGVTVADKFTFLKCIGKKLAVNYTIIRITTVQHELDHLQKKLDDTKMKLIIEIKQAWVEPLLKSSFAKPSHDDDDDSSADEKAGSI